MGFGAAVAGFGALAAGGLGAVGEVWASTKGAAQSKEPLKNAHNTKFRFMGKG